MNYKLSFLVLFLFFISNVSATGIEFRQGSLKELMEEAKAQDKIIFIDAYTTWCVPCKVMDRKVFANPAVGEAFNEHFINAKFDMDMPGSSKVKYDYGVDAYPTLLFIDSEGTLIRKIRGTRPAQMILDIGMEIANQETPGQLIKRYEAGERNPEFLKQYFEMQILLGRAHELRDELSTYLETQEDLMSQTNFSFMLYAPGPPNGRRMKTLLQNGELVMQNNSSKNYMKILQTSFIENARKEYNISEKLPDIALMSLAYRDYGGPLIERLTLHYTFLKALGEKKLNELSISADAYLMKYPSNDITEIHEFVSLIATESKEPNQFKIALKYALKSVSLNPKNWVSFALVSKCYKALGEKEKAKKSLEKAKDLGATKQMLKFYK